jgi:hypothetical protein
MSAGQPSAPPGGRAPGAGSPFIDLLSTMPQFAGRFGQPTMQAKSYGKPMGKEPDEPNPGYPSPGASAVPGATAVSPAVTGGNSAVSPGATAPAGGEGNNFGGFAPQKPWLGIPFNQTYGGQPAPFDNQHTQILNTMLMGDAGAGRFNNNSADRYSFAGGRNNFRQDATPFGQERMPYSYQPQNPFAGFGRPPGPAPQQPGGMAPKVSAGAGFDPAAAFKTLMAEDPTLAFQATNTGSMQNWYMQNKDKPGFLQQFGYNGDPQSFANQGSPQGGNTSWTPDRINRLMALGIK